MLELEATLSEEKVQAYLAALELESADAWTLFSLMKSDDANPSIDIEEFVMGCLRLKGYARSIDIAKIMHDNAAVLNKLDEIMSNTKNIIVQPMTAKAII